MSHLWQKSPIFIMSRLLLQWILCFMIWRKQGWTTIPKGTVWLAHNQCCTPQKKKKRKEKYPAVKYSGSNIVLCDYISSAGTGKLVNVEGIMNTVVPKRSQYWHKSSRFLREVEEVFNLSEWYQPNAYIQILCQRNVNILEWHSQTPRWNPDESCPWRKVHKRCPTLNQPELEQFCRDLRYDIAKSICTKPTDSYMKLVLTNTFWQKCVGAHDMCAKKKYFTQKKYFTPKK